MPHGKWSASLQKAAAFQPSRTAIQNIINEMGELLEHHEDVLLDEVRLREELPVNEAKVFVVSLDGVNAGRLCDDI